MEEQLYIFDPATNTSKAPIPTTFEHLLKYVTRVEQYLSLHSQEDIVNINNQLDQTLNLMVSNIIQRVIAQVIGQTDKGFATIKGTDDGSLHVHVTGSDEISHTIQTAKISITGAANHDITAAAPSGSYHICSIMFVAAGDVTVTLRDESGTLTGPMSFGGADEPRGMTHNFGLAPLICTAGEKFQINLDAGIQVSGLITYYDA